MTVRRLKSTSMVCLAPVSKTYITIPNCCMTNEILTLHSSSRKNNAKPLSSLHNCLSFGRSATERWAAPYYLPEKEINRHGLGNSWIHNGRGSHRLLQAFVGNHMRVLLPQQSEEQHRNNQKQSDIKLDPCKQYVGDTIDKFLRLD